MELELLISALKADSQKLIKKMNVTQDAVLINQIGINATNEFPVSHGLVRVIKTATHGVGLSRNMAIEASRGDIVLFSDDDIVYKDDLSEIVLGEFSRHPEADGIFFNVSVCEERRTYENVAFGPINSKNYGRYPAYSFAVRRSRLLDSKVKFSTIFGGGAKYSCGEDSLFFKDLLNAGLKLFKTASCIGEEVPRPSTWFNGYNKKYFFDRGVLYHFLYGRLAYPLGIRYVLSKRKLMCHDVKPLKAIQLVMSGIREGRKIDSTTD